ncbi:MAG: hypothetical protein NXI32_29770 [bacterium]|nr:hypothetical protein [bacterium]
MMRKLLTSLVIMCMVGQSLVPVPTHSQERAWSDGSFPEIPAALFQDAQTDPADVNFASALVPVEGHPLDNQIFGRQRTDYKPVVPVGDTEDPSSLRVGGFRIRPYGSLWTSAVVASNRTNPGPFTLWVLPVGQSAETAFELDARRTRAGLDIEGPELNLLGSSFDTSAIIEVDFFGEFLTENSTGVRLREAYWQAESDGWTLLAGQTWDIINPLRPRTVNFSVGWAGGNIGFRRTQLRLERAIPLRVGELQWQGSINQDIIPDFRTVEGINRESAAYPVIMTRVGYRIPSGIGRGFQIGASGHIGETGFDFTLPGPPPLNIPPEDDARFKTWSVNLDLEIPLSSTLMLRGEGFHGSNLSPFLGGIGQGVCPCNRGTIHSSGGWGEVAKQWNDHFDSHLGGGIDDPANGDFLIGRSLNQFIFVNTFWRCNEQLSTGLELTWWRTAYTETRGGLIPPEELLPAGFNTSYVTEWTIRYDF